MLLAPAPRRLWPMRMATDVPDFGDAKLLILAVERDPHIRELEAHYLNNAGFA